MADKNLFNNMGFAKNAKAQPTGKGAYSYEKLKTDLMKALEDTKNTGPVKVRRKVEYIEDDSPPPPKPAKPPVQPAPSKDKPQPQLSLTTPKEPNKPTVPATAAPAATPTPTPTVLPPVQPPPPPPPPVVVDPKPKVAEIPQPQQVVLPPVVSQPKTDPTPLRLHSGDRRGKMFERSTSPIVIRRSSLSQPAPKPTFVEHKRVSIPTETSPQLNHSRRQLRRLSGGPKGPSKIDYLTRDPLDEADPLKYWILNGRSDDIHHMPQVFKLPDTKLSREQTFNRNDIGGRKKPTDNLQDNKGEADEFKNWILNGKQDFHNLNSVIQFPK